MHIRLSSTPEFDEWLRESDAKSRAQVDDRLDRVREYGHFGPRRYFGGELYELKWKSGRRVYYSLVDDGSGIIVLLLLGGDKHGQKKDVAKARKIMEREAA
ncbi:MAG: type II toxin-antitoxin system RelE/ParE family toxin [Elusimicrobiota bacterium]